MIEIKDLIKRFDDNVVLNGISFTIADSSIFGLVGSNGAGKSTLLRILAGVFYTEGGNVYMDGQAPFENIDVKEKTAFVSDFPYFLPGATLDSTAKYYRSLYNTWSDERYAYYRSVFPINPMQKISAMSKGMQRQSAIIIALSYSPKYILFDEIFDGLDPVIRELVKKILIEYIEETHATVVIASHNLRELEGFCDHIGLLHKGGILLERDINSESIGVFRIQFIPESEASFETIRPQLNITKENHQGRIIELTVRGKQDEIESVINTINPQFYEVLPLTLEELFISEMEAAGYEINNIIKQ